MDKRNIFYILLTIILSILAFVLTLKLVFRTEKINEGKFRVADVIVTSTAELTDKTAENDVWSLNLSQRNILSMLIENGNKTKIRKIYISDLKVKSKNPITFYMLDNEEKLTLTNVPQKLDVEYEIEENGQIKLEIVALNENVLRNWEVPEGTNEIICDGRIFNMAGLSLKDIQFDLTFKLNIVEEIGKNNVLKVKLTLPSEELLINGADIRRLDKTQFKFKVN
ncbi:MAG: hypothetical protein IKL68_01905 [Clostridia bacterium]|nr:hypothetical protein [Clostridia bacterium]